MRIGKVRWAEVRSDEIRWDHMSRGDWMRAGDIG